MRLKKPSIAGLFAIPAIYTTWPWLRGKQRVRGLWQLILVTNEFHPLFVSEPLGFFKMKADSADGSPHIMDRHGRSSEEGSIETLSRMGHHVQVQVSFRIPVSTED